MLKYKPKKNVKPSLHPMSVTTKDFIQKICYRRTASVDMTQYGFISDSKTRPMCLMLKPLKDKLKTICDQTDERQRRKTRKIKKIHFSPETYSPKTREKNMKQQPAPTIDKAKKARNRSAHVSLARIKTGVIKVKHKKVTP